MSYQLLEPNEHKNEKPGVPTDDPLFIALTKLFEECASQHPCPCGYKGRCLLLFNSIAGKSSRRALDLVTAGTYEVKIRRFINYTGPDGRINTATGRRMM